MDDRKPPPIAFRVPDATYAILRARSKEWQMSVSGIVREVVIKMFNESDEGAIKAYRNRERGDYDTDIGTSAGDKGSNGSHRSGA